MPSALAASAAMSGDTLPMLFSPSVSSTITLDLEGSLRSRLAHMAMAEPMAVPSSTVPTLTRSKILLEPIVVERERADEIRCARKFYEAEAVVGPLIDELRDDRFDDADAVRRLAVDLEVE